VLITSGGVLKSYMAWIIPAIVSSYILGSIPTAYIFGRLLKGIDLRKFGSGNIGATNALRVLGKGPGITVLLLDILKGIVAVVFLGDFFVLRLPFISTDTLRIILGLSCICGHNWSIFLKFRGGKGVATTFGVLLGLAIKIAGLWLILLLTILTWLAVFLIARIVSVASVSTGISLPVYMFIFKQSPLLLFLGCILAVFVILRHKSNLQRVLQGKEPRINFKPKA
jgi:glycerol-3-phosphate acyltransferase PlsY